MNITSSAIDFGLWSIQRELMQRHGTSAAERYMQPLKWYINTGRASITFLRCLFSARPVLIAHDLAKGGSDEEIINRVCSRIRYTREG